LHQSIAADFTQRLVNAYRAMDVFVFASHSETQGLVLIEAMAAGTPVVAVDAPGVREVVQDGVNGRLLPVDNARQFAQALHALERLSWSARRRMRRNAHQTAQGFSMERCASRALKLYAAMCAKQRRSRLSPRVWERAAHQIQAEAKLFKRTAKATTAMLTETTLHR
jgi:glycosyltransferase involved in cell wall biosynthesis